MKPLPLWLVLAGFPLGLAAIHLVTALIRWLAE